MYKINDDIIYSALIESRYLERNKTKKRKAIWFNPPYCMNVKNNFGKTFLKLVKNHFVSNNNNSFLKVFNKNTISISYSYMRNFSSIIASRNKLILGPKAKEFGFN